jgi:type IV secretion system protein TrbC
MTQQTLIGLAQRRLRLASARLAAPTALTAAAMLVASAAQASTSSSSSGLPWESPLSAVATSLTGPVPGAISLVAVAASGLTLVFGGELNEFAKRMAYLVMVLGVLLGVAKLVSGLGLSAAVIASNAPLPTLLAHLGAAV